MLYLNVQQVRGEIFAIFSQIISINFHKRGKLESLVVKIPRNFKINGK